MNAGKQSSSQLLGALFRGDTDGLSRMLQQAMTEYPAAARAAAGQAAGQMRTKLEIPDGVRQALREGRTIEAVRQVREANPGSDVGTAKQAIDALAGRLPASPEPAGLKDSAGKLRSSAMLALAKAQRPPTVAPGDRGGARAVIYALAMAGGALAWWMYSGR